MSAAGERLIEHDLERGERLIWKGRPATGIRFRSSDLFFVPFSLLWGGFAIFWEFSVITLPGSQSARWFWLFGLPFVAIGLYLIIGRFFADAWQRRNTDYALTNRRAIIRSGLFSRKITSVNLRSIPDMSVTETANGSGTIDFGQTTASFFRYQSFPRGIYWPGMPQPPAFEMIDDVRRVQGLIHKAIDEK